MKETLKFLFLKAYAGMNQDPVTRSGYFPDEGSVNDWKPRTKKKPSKLKQVRGFKIRK